MNKKENTCFFTGHRIISDLQKNSLKMQIKSIASKLIENHNVTDFIAGGAIGFDTIASYSILELKAKYPSIKLHLYLPCTDQTRRWNKSDTDKWSYILKHADSYRYITDGKYIPGCMQLRNHAMVDSSCYCIAFCTRKNSGTHSTLALAERQNVDIYNINKNDI